MTNDIASETQAQLDADAKAKENERLTKLYQSHPGFWLTPTIKLTPWRNSEADIASLVKYLNMSEIYSFLVGPPYPYKPEDGHFWISTRPLEMTPKGTPLDYCIRDMAAGGMAIGSVHISAESDENLDGGDIGYWLAPEYHGKGLVAKALGLLLQEVSIKEVGKRKFNARAFQGNWASRKTMEKVGFVFHEEILLKNRAGEMVPSWTMRLVLTDEDLARREVLEQATPLPELALL